MVCDLHLICVCGQLPFNWHLHHQWVSVLIVGLSCLFLLGKLKIMKEICFKMGWDHFHAITELSPNSWCTRAVFKCLHLSCSVLLHVLWSIQALIATRFCKGQTSQDQPSPCFKFWSRQQYSQDNIISTMNNTCTPGHKQMRSLRRPKVGPVQCVCR
jgi:hypothetical protein